MEKRDFSIGDKVKVVKPLFESQDPKYSRVGQSGEIVQFSGHGMPCVHFNDLDPGIGVFMNASEIEKID